jgi:hypothetical protein
MKKLILCILFCGTTFICNAQLMAEWFNQRATQKKYLLQQIAALQIYMAYIEKGYNIAKSGLATIDNIKEGHFNLDKDFFNSLENINPRVKNYSRVADILMLSIKIVKQCKHTMANVKENNEFSGNETAYMEKVFTSLINESVAIINDLIDLITDGKFNMSDDERISRINGIYQDMQEHYLFVRHFSNDASLVNLQRKIEEKDARVLEVLNGL